MALVMDERDAGMSEHKVSMSGYLPGEAKNGLVELEAALTGVETPDTIVAVVLIDRTARQVKDHSDEVKASLRLSAVEPLKGEDREKALALLNATREQRTGEASLDLGDES